MSIMEGTIETLHSFRIKDVSQDLVDGPTTEELAEYIICLMSMADNPKIDEEIKKYIEEG